MTNMVDEVLKINLMKINRCMGFFEPLKSTRKVLVWHETALLLLPDVFFEV